MGWVAAFVLVGWLQAPVGSPVAGDLAAVRGLYTSAAYDDALALVERLDPAAVTPELEQYRALCLLALGRTLDGERAFERLVRRSPLYVIPDGEVSPRVLNQFRDVRRRVLPAVVRDLYARGKASFDRKDFGAVTTEFGELLRVLHDPDLLEGADLFADIGLVVEGFLKLAAIEQAAAAEAAAEADRRAAAARAAAEAPPAPQKPADGIVVTRIVVYSRDDKDVTPPVEVERPMPVWSPPAVIARSEFRGTLEVVVDESGAVEDARMVQPTMPSYDLSLLSATRRWRFSPARRNGEAVKYRLIVDIVLAPRR